MISPDSRRHGTAVLAGVFLLLSGLSPVTFAQDLTDPIAADARRDGGAIFQVDTDSESQLGNVIAAAIERVLDFAPVRFRFSGGNKAFVSWVSNISGTKLIDVGIIVDDGVPF